MAANSSERRNLPLGFVFALNGRELIEFYLFPRAFRGDIVRTCHIADGVDVFCASPDALPFVQPRESACGYFFAAHPAGERTPVPGGCWLPYGPEKAYRVVNGRQVMAFRRRFVFHVPWQGADDGEETWAQTEWQMKEYRLNKGAAAFLDAHHDPRPRANMDCVIRKVFVKQVDPPLLPTPALHSSDDQDNTGPSMNEEARGYSGEGQPRKRARFGRRRDARGRAATDL